MSFRFLTAVIQIVAFWVVTPCTDVAGYRHFSELRCLHLQGDGILFLRSDNIPPHHYTASQPRRLRLTLYYCIHKSPQLDCILSHLNTAHIHTPYFFNIYFIIILPSTYSFQAFRLKCLCAFLISLCVLHVQPTSLYLIRSP
jgi:hypothetical protein